MLLRIDPASRQPIFDQLSAQLRLAIVAGEAAPGERLPAARDLAGSLDINVHTVLRSYQALRDEGLIELRPGRGAVVGRHQRELGEVRRALADLISHADAARLPTETLIALLRQMRDGPQPDEPEPDDPGAPTTTTPAATTTEHSEDQA